MVFIEWGVNMKVNNVGVNKVVNLYNVNKKSIDKNSVQEKKDTIEISSLGKSLSALSLDDTLEKSSQKIEALRKEVSQGTYKADSSLIASRMLHIIKGRGV